MCDVCVHTCEDLAAGGRLIRAEEKQDLGGWAGGCRVLHLQGTDIVFPEAGGRLMDPVEEEGCRN